MLDWYAQVAIPYFLSPILYFEKSSIDLYFYYYCPEMVFRLLVRTKKGSPGRKKYVDQFGLLGPWTPVTEVV